MLFPVLHLLITIVGLLFLGSGILFQSALDWRVGLTILLFSVATNPQRVPR